MCVHKGGSYYIEAGVAASQKKIAGEDTLVVATATCIRVPGGAKVFETPQCRGFLIKDGK